MLRHLAAAACAAALALPAAPAHAAGTFTLAGSAHDDCFGCYGSTAGLFTGTGSGLVRGHQYDNATVTIGYAKATGSGPLACWYDGTSAVGTMDVTDGVQTDSLPVSLTRRGTELELSFAFDRGTGQGTWVIVEPAGIPCGSQVTAEVRAVVVFLS